jgi:hypothetical protein
MSAQKGLIRLILLMIWGSMVFDVIVLIVGLFESIPLVLGLISSSTFESIYQKSFLNSLLLIGLAFLPLCKWFLIGVIVNIILAAIIWVLLGFADIDLKLLYSLFKEFRKKNEQ